MSQIKTKFIEDSAVTGAKISDGSVDNVDLANNAVTSGKIQDGTVSNSDLANVSTQTIKGRVTAGTGSPEDLTATQATSILNNFVGDSGSGGTKGLVPAPAALDYLQNRFVHADGTFRHPIEPEKMMTFYEEFMGGTSNSASGGLSNGLFSSTCSGTGTTFSVTSSNQNARTPGIFAVGTGSTSTGRGSGVAGFILLGHGQMIFKTNINFSTLSNDTQRYSFDVGVYDQGGTSSPIDEGIYFYYDHATSLNWICRTAAAGVTTSTTTSVAVEGGNTGDWQELMFVVNTAWNEVKFYIDNVLVATHTTNISTAAVKPSIRTIKSVGSLARSALIDYMFIQQTFTSAR